MSSDNMNPADGDESGRDDMPEPDATITGRPGLQPDTQGDEPLDAELGEDGQGDLAEGDAQLHTGDAPDDLRTEGPSGAVHEEQN